MKKSFLFALGSGVAVQLVSAGRGETHRTLILPTGPDPPPAYSSQKLNVCGLGIRTPNAIGLSSPQPGPPPPTAYSSQKMECFISVHEPLKSCSGSRDTQCNGLGENNPLASLNQMEAQIGSRQMSVEFIYRYWIYPANY